MFASHYSSPYFTTQYDPHYNRYLARQHLAQKRALEQQRAAREQQLRRAQYLPHEAFSDDDEEHHGYTPWEQRAYAHRGMRETLEQKRLEAMQQEALRQEAIRRELARQQDEQRRCAYSGEHHRPSPQNAHSVHTMQTPAMRRSASPTAPTTQPFQSAPRGPQRSRSPPTNRDVSPSPPAPVETHTTQSPSPSPSPERREEAANKIQTTYRIHRAFRTIANIERQFDPLKQTFSLPGEIDYETDYGIVTVTVSPDVVSPAPLPGTPKLAFTPTNYKLHAYIEALNRLLIKLDSVESWGDPAVRKARRRIVGLVEAEASRVEAHWKQAWAAHIQIASHAVDEGKPDEEHMQEDADGSPVRGEETELPKQRVPRRRGREIRGGGDEGEEESDVSEDSEDSVMALMDEAEDLEGSQDDMMIEEVGDASMGGEEVQNMQEMHEGDASGTWEPSPSKDRAADTSTTDHPPVSEISERKGGEVIPVGEAEEGSQDDIMIGEVRAASVAGEEIQTMQERHEGDASGTWEPPSSDDTAADTPPTESALAISPKSPDLDLGEGDGFVLV